MPSELRNILIIGASSAGAPLARALEKKVPPSHRIVLVDAQVRREPARTPPPLPLFVRAI